MSGSSSSWQNCRGLAPARPAAPHFYLIKNREKLLSPLSLAMAEAQDKVTVCRECGNVDTIDPCTICTDQRRDRTILCVVEEVGDLWALERAGAWTGLYHVLGGTLSAMEGIRPEDLAINHLIERAAVTGMREVVLATNATVEGQTTAHYITERLKGLGSQHLKARPWRARGRRIGLSRRRHADGCNACKATVLIKTS